MNQKKAHFVENLFEYALEPISLSITHAINLFGWLCDFCLSFAGVYFGMFWFTLFSPCLSFSFFYLHRSLSLLALSLHLSLFPSVSLWIVRFPAPVRIRGLQVHAQSLTPHIAAITSEQIDSSRIIVRLELSIEIISFTVHISHI